MICTTTMPSTDMMVGEKMLSLFTNKVFVRAIWSSLSRMIAVSLGAVAGTIVARSVGNHITHAWPVAIAILFVGFMAMLFAEYEKGRHN